MLTSGALLHNSHHSPGWKLCTQLMGPLKSKKCLSGLNACVTWSLKITERHVRRNKSISKSNVDRALITTGCNLPPTYTHRSNMRPFWGWPRWLYSIWWQQPWWQLLKSDVWPIRCDIFSAHVVLEDSFVRKKSRSKIIILPTSAIAFNCSRQRVSKSVF